MTTGTSSRELKEQIVGKRISGVIARPGRRGEPPMVLMLRFEDGSVVEFVSPRSDRILRQALSANSGGGKGAETSVTQLPLQGLAA